MRLKTLSLCGLICIAAPAAALAQSTPTQPSTAQAAPAQARATLTVAGLRAPDGDNDLASELSDALREAARGRGFEVPANTPALDQEFAMLGCSTTTPDCLSPIADDLHAPRFLYGSVLRVGRGRDAQLTVEVTLWDDTTHHASPPPRSPSRARSSRRAPTRFASSRGSSSKRRSAARPAPRLRRPTPRPSDADRRRPARASSRRASFAPPRPRLARGRASGSASGCSARAPCSAAWPRGSGP
ncbi:MAG: hypothetical protein U0326_35815 [Polyangiales bacterium]